MTVGMLLFYVLLGALLAWPCWRLMHRALDARRPLVCVQPYRPRLPVADAGAAAMAQRNPP